MARTGPQAGQTSHLRYYWAVRRLPQFFHHYLAAVVIAVVVAVAHAVVVAVAPALSDFPTGSHHQAAYQSCFYAQGPDGAMRQS